MPDRLANAALEVIRASTRDAHAALDATLEIARAESGEAEYFRYIGAVLGWLEPLETALWQGPWPDVVAPGERRDKSAWIVSDLRERGLTDAEVAAIPRCESLPPLDSAAARFGAAYVVEGAQLGGRALLKELGPRLAPRRARWLEGYGSETAARWRAFVAALGAELPDGTEARVAAESAQRTFAWVHSWFTLRGVA